MAETPARAEEVRALFECAEVLIDELVVERIVELGASRANVEEALRVDGKAPSNDPPPSNSRVAEIRALLAELLENRRPGDPVTCSAQSPGPASSSKNL